MKKRINSQSDRPCFPVYDMESIGNDDPKHYITEVKPDGSRMYMYIGPGSDMRSVDAAPAEEFDKRPRVNKRIGRRALLALGGAGLAIGAGIIADHLAEQEQPVSTQYFVQPGDTLWDVTIEHTDGECIDPACIHHFIDSNIDNVTAEEMGRSKDDLRPGDELIITDPTELPAAADGE